MAKIIDIRETRWYINIYKRLEHAHTGGLVFGLDWNTISESWQNALKRVGFRPNGCQTLTPEPTAYELLCGSIWEYERQHKNGQHYFSVVLWQECPGLPTYHVRCTDWDNGGRQFWNTYGSLHKAKYAFWQAIGDQPVPESDAEW